MRTEPLYRGKEGNDGDVSFLGRCSIHILFSRFYCPKLNRRYPHVK